MIPVIIHAHDARLSFPSRPRPARLLVAPAPIVRRGVAAGGQILYQDRDRAGAPKHLAIKTLRLDEPAHVEIAAKRILIWPAEEIRTAVSPSGNVCPMADSPGNPRPSRQNPRPRSASTGLAPNTQTHPWQTIRSSSSRAWAAARGRAQRLSANSYTRKYPVRKKTGPLFSLLLLNAAVMGRLPSCARM